MTSISSLYFDGAIVQIVNACISSSTVTIKEAHTFPLDELDDYLSHCREKRFIICANPVSFHQDIIYLPPAAGRQYDKLVRAEAQKLHPELTSFSTFHTAVGQATIDSKVFNKIAVFSYADGFISGLLSTFNKHGKVVSQVYAAPYSIFKLIASSCLNDANRSRIFIASLPGEKLLLVGENGELEFIRKIPSSDAKLLPIDLQNINMTLDYCFQTLRVKPVEAVMLEQSETFDEQSAPLSVPLRSALPAVLASVPHDIIADYIAPLAAAIHYIETPRVCNLLPSDYAAFITHKKLLTAAAMLMFVLTLFLGGYLVTETMIISELKSKIGRLRIELSGSGSEIAAFKKLDAEVNLLKQPLDFSNKHISSLNPAKALAALILPVSKEYVIKGITIQSGGGSLPVRIEGAINVSGYSNTQAAFERLVTHVAKLPGYAVSSSSVDIKQKTFGIQTLYSDGEQRVK
jgi:hypothetical protein